MLYINQTVDFKHVSAFWFIGIWLDKKDKIV